VFGRTAAAPNGGKRGVVVPNPLSLYCPVEEEEEEAEDGVGRLLRRCWRCGMPLGEVHGPVVAPEIATLPEGSAALAADVCTLTSVHRATVMIHVALLAKGLGAVRRSTRRAWSPRAPSARACAEYGYARTASRTRCTRTSAPHRAPSPRANADGPSASSPARTPSTRSPRLHGKPAGGPAVGPYSRIAWNSPGSREGEGRREDASEPRASGQCHAACRHTRTPHTATRHSSTCPTRERSSRPPRSNRTSPSLLPTRPLIVHPHHPLSHLLHLPPHPQGHRLRPQRAGRLRRRLARRRRPARLPTCVRRAGAGEWRG
jgi:hypothetical protein